MNKAIKAVIFDMDGLMFDTERISFICFSEALKAHGLKLDEQFFGKTIGTNIKVTEELYLQRYGAEVTHSKPAPEIFCKAAEKLSCPVENCLVLEDAPKGILAAHRAGIKTILIPDLAQIDEAAKSLAAATLPSLDEVISYLSK